MPGLIFISYRRDDAAYVTGHINDRLCKEFGPESIFTDVDNIALGVDFRKVLDDKVGQCQILLAVIGSNWINAKSHEGELRLQDPADFVRIEIESALKRKIPVIPLLVAGTEMPSKDELPDSLQDLSFRNGIQIRPVPDFHADIDRLIQSLKKHLDTVSSEPPEIERDDQERERIQHESGPDRRQERRQEDTQRSFSDTNVIPEDDERLRKQAELNQRQTKRRKSSFIYRSLFVLVILIVAGVSWYIDFEYEKQYNNVIETLSATQKPEADNESEPVAESIAKVQPETETIAVVQSEAEHIAEVGAEPDAIIETRDAPESIVAAVEASTTEDEAVAIVDSIADAQNETNEDASTQSDADIESQLKLDASAAFREGISLAALGNHEEAILNYDEAIRLLEEPAFVHKQRGASYLALGDYEAAVTDYGEAIRLNAEDANAYYNRGVAYRELEDHVAAIENYDEAIRLDPEFASAYHNRGISNEALGNNEAAESDLAFAAALRSKQFARD